MHRLFNRLAVAYLSARLRDALPKGYRVYKVDHYSEHRHLAPHLHIERCSAPDLDFFAVVSSDTHCVSSVGRSRRHAVENCIAKITRHRGNS